MIEGWSAGKRKYLLAAGALGVALVGYALFGGKDSAEIAPAIASTARPAAAQPATGGQTAASLPDLSSADALGAGANRPSDCLIEPSQVVRVNSAVEGVIQSITVDRGQFVQRGQVVAQLRSDVERAGLAVAQARAANSYTVGAAEAKARYLSAKQDRSEKLNRYLARDAVEEAQANAASASMQRDEAQLSQRVAQLEYNQSQRLMAERTVRSPVSGVVTERAMSPGEYRANESSHILTIAQINPLYVEVFAPISQLKSVSLGDTAYVYPEEPVGGRYAARVKVIDRVFDAASGTFGLRLELPNPDNKLPAGLRCRIEFNT